MSPVQTSGARISFLHSLNSSSFATLAHISLTITMSAYPHLLARQSEFTIQDPYLGLCEAPLSDLLALETLDVTLTLQGNFNFHIFNFGGKWGVLCEILSAPGAHPKLKRVGISIGIRGIDAGRSRLAINSSHPATNLLARYFDHFVKPQFQALEVLRLEGALDFSFAVRVWDGSRLVQVQR